MPFRFLPLITILVIAASASLVCGRQEQAAYEALRTQAEKLYQEGSYAKAREAYLRADALQLPPLEARWVDFRLADTLWRAQAGTQTHDSTDFDRARAELQALIQKIERVEDRDLVWAEAQESLGDFWWERQRVQDWGQAWQSYQLALDYWAGASDIDAARKRYLHMVWTMSEPSWMRHGGYHGWNNVPLDVLENAVKIAVEPADQARAHYLLARSLRHHGDLRQQMRIPPEFDAALTFKTKTDWYDDALYGYAEWLMNQGRVEWMENGQWVRQPDYVKAAELFRTLLREFDKGETSYWDQASSNLAAITNRSLALQVSNIYLPGSEVQYHLSWRNLGQIELSLYKVDLTNDLDFPDNQRLFQQWISQIDLTRAEKSRTWIKQTEDKGDHRPGSSAERLDDPPPPGAYVIVASSGQATARDLILITDAAAVLKTSGDQALVYACNALNSAPLPNASVRLWKAVHAQGSWRLDSLRRQADDQGLCVFNADDFPNLKGDHIQYFAAVSSDERQAVAFTHSHRHDPNDGQWRIYTFTDRPAYRPKESVNWKLIARQGGDKGYQTPGDRTIEYQINDPRSTKVAEGTAALNAFGSAWGSLELTEAMPLGEYQVQFWRDKDRRNHIGQATLFRLEEYKLPEFRVTISTPQEDGRKKSYVLGEYVEAAIQADYYFGGPVANANVEVIVYQNPYYRWWHPVRDYPWVYEDQNPYRYWGGGDGQIIKRETIKTDHNGKAVVTFETPVGGQQDFEYRIEARVTDASRREIISTDTVRVTRQRYYVHATPAHQIHKPGDSIEINFKAMDANDQPVQTEGAVHVTRDQWIEIWIDPTGKEVTGAELRRLQQEIRIFPPPPINPIAAPWRLKFRGYTSEDVLKTTVKLDDKGEGLLRFAAPSEGYYTVRWKSDPGFMPVGIPSVPITTETAVWVATDRTTELGYRHDGLQIIVDAETFRIGQAAPVMINTPTADRYVLFSVEGNNLYSYQLVHVTGNVKLVQVPIDERHVPNIYLSAMMAHNGELHQDLKQITIPPVEQYLKVEVASNQQQFQPGEEGTYTIRTTTHDGKPASAEVALSVADEAVAYIQQDYAGDPRAFFFQRRQSQLVTLGASFHQKAYIKLVKWNDDQLIDERLRADLEQDRDGDMAGKWDERGQADKLGRLEKSEMRRRAAGAGGAPGPVTANARDEMEFAWQAGGARDQLAPMSEAKLGASVAAKPGEANPPQEPNVVVRSDFRSTLLWEPSIITDEDGVATVSMKYADSLTGWLATARVAGKGNQFGTGSTSTRTRMPLIARLQAPRFFLVGDTVTISGVINNNTDQPMTVRASLEASGITIEAGDDARAQTVEIAANSEARIDWQTSVSSLGNGNATLKLTARGEDYADAMEKSYPVYEHGVERFLAKAGKVRGSEVTVTLDVPSARKVESTSLVVQVSPSMAVTMLDALPYLIDYPYGCTEQTMSRFLPTVITAKTLSDLGVKPEVAMSKVFGGIEQQHVGKTHPKGKKTLEQIELITQASLDRLYNFQHDDGGWGWWKDGDTDHFMSAYVLWGLCLAKDAGLDVRADALDRAAHYLDRELVEQEVNHDLQAWMLHALAAHHASTGKEKVGEFQGKALENLWTNRDRLNAYTRALLALCAHTFNDDDKARILVENLENGVKRDAQPDQSVLIKGAPKNAAVIGTAHWGNDPVDGWWRWSDGGIEATAFALRAILAIDPKNELVEPVTNWLIKNRRGAQWSNTRDTAIVVLAMNDYLRISGELAPELEYELLVNGKSIASKKLSAEDALSAPSRYAIEREHIRDGANEIRIVRKNGAGPIYFAAEATFFSLEEPVPASGNEIFIKREYYKLSPRPTLLKGYVYDRLPLGDGGTVNSGERVEVVMTIEAKNNYEYLVLEDLKAAGLEAVAVRSGESVFAKELKKAGIERIFGAENKAEREVQAEQAHSGAEEFTGRMQWVYQELRDRKVALFIDKLPEGVWEIRYDLRAEVPGRFHALPVLGHAMYVPEIRANSAEIRIGVVE